MAGAQWLIKRVPWLYSPCRLPSCHFQCLFEAVLVGVNAERATRWTEQSHPREPAVGGTMACVWAARWAQWLGMRRGGWAGGQAGRSRLLFHVAALGVRSPCCPEPSTL